MALNLVKSGKSLMVWNRSLLKSGTLAEAGAAVAKDPAEVFAKCDVVILMLADSAAIDEVLARGAPAFEKRVKARMLVNMATVEPDFSRELDADVRAAGGRYVEAPVSGSRKPAEAATLVAMLAGDEEDVAIARHLVAPMCRDVIICGPAPNALFMKLAVNLFLIAMVTGLAEAAHLAERLGLDLTKFLAVLNAGPMASDVSKIKGAKLVDLDFSRQAAITDVLKNNRLVVETAREAGVASPLIDVCYGLYAETQELGFGDEDMVAVIRAIEQRTAKIR
jgi:3-hydroxyisobutyrate dehydrogenase